MITLYKSMKRDHRLYEAAFLAPLLKGVAKAGGAAMRGGMKLGSKLMRSKLGRRVLARGVRSGISTAQRTAMNRAEDRADMEPFNRAKMIDQINKIGNQGQ